MGEAALGWMITVQLPDGDPPQVYNVAIPDERQAIEAVKRIVPDAKGTMVKIKSQLVERVYKALKMKRGDVLAGAQHREKQKKRSEPRLGDSR